MTLESDAKFEERLTCGLKNEIRNQTNFHHCTQKSQNECKIQGSVMCYGNEE